MPTGHVMMALTLDGYVARKDYSIDWLMKQDTCDEEHDQSESCRQTISKAGARP